MNYSHDTEMDRDWAADQLRRKKNALSGLPDSPIRRTAAALPQVAVAAVQGLQGAAATPPGAATLGNALSALAINAGSAEHVQRICHGLLALLYDKECLPVHQEFAQLKAPRLLEASLRCLHGLTFDTEARLWRGPRLDGKTRAIVCLAWKAKTAVVSSNDEQNTLDEAWDDTAVICKRVLQRLNDGRKTVNRRPSHSSHAVEGA
ncbi:unnamed protein product [Symbiodinium sp. CCMP2592]|nr:unnamed protein product [Symbiodinium sp. CCMP2592]